MNPKPTESTSQNDGISRRKLITRTGQIAAASALAGIAIPHVNAQANSTVQIALIGCGSRSTARRRRVAVERRAAEADRHGGRL